jgi:hypothetical protein
MDGRLLTVTKDVMKRTIFGGDMLTTSLIFTDKAGKVYPDPESDDLPVSGFATVISIRNDMDGTGRFQSRGDSSAVTFLEADLIALGAKTRDIRNRLAITGWIVRFTLPTGEYVASLSEPMPDSTLGIVKYIINVYEED